MVSEENQARADEVEAGLFQIEEAARRTGLTTRTLRYYEEKGLVVPARHGDSNYRLYSAADLERLERIKQWKDLLAFSLDEIGELLEVEQMRLNYRAEYKASQDRAEKRQKLLDVRRMNEREVSLIDDKLQRLEKLKQDVLARIERNQKLLAQLENSED